MNPIQIQQWLALVAEIFAMLQQFHIVPPMASPTAAAGENTLTPSQQQSLAQHIAAFHIAANVLAVK